MTFGDFARNYLNPFYVVFRLGWIGGGGVFVLTGMYADGLGSIGQLLAFALGGLAIWNGLRPWGRGKSMKEINDDLDNLNKRF